MARLRLTKRHRKAAVDQTPYSGDIGNEGRQDPEYGKYDNYVELPGWELPDMDHEWKEDARNEMHIPIMRSASIARIRRAASKAVKLAVLLLGDKVEEKVIEDQARELMRLGEKYLENALKRYSATEKLYAEDEDKEEAEEKEESKKAEEKEEEAEEKEESKKAEEDDEEEACKTKKSEDEDKEEAEDEKEESKKAEDEEEAMTYSENEMDIEMESAEEVEMSEEDEEVLSKLFAEDEDKEEAEEDEEEACKTKKASKKGIQKLGGQVKVASKDDAENLTNLWESAPDVNSIFK